jgi:hypothetical protein
LARIPPEQFETSFEAGSLAREFGPAHHDFGRFGIVRAEIFEIGPRPFQLGFQLSQAMQNVGGRRLRNSRHPPIVPQSQTHHRKHWLAPHFAPLPGAREK